MNDSDRALKSLIEAVLLDDTHHGGLLRNETLALANRLKLELAIREREEAERAVAEAAQGE